MRVAVLAALILSPWFAQAAPGQRLTVPRLPDLPDIDLSEMELPEIDVQVLADVPQIVASEEGDEDQDSDEGTDEHEHPGVHVYKMRPEQRIRIPRIHEGWGHGEWNEGKWWSDATAQAKGRGGAALPVKGPVTFQLHAQAGDIDVVSTDKQQVMVTVSDAPPEDVALYAFGDRVEPSFRGRRSLRRGKMRGGPAPRGAIAISPRSGEPTAPTLAEGCMRTPSRHRRLSPLCAGR